MRKTYIWLILLFIISIISYLTFRILQLMPLIIDNVNDPIRGPQMLNQVLSILGNRGIRVVGLMIAATLTGLTAVMFQTYTNNRILTPAVLGFDSIYLVIQTTIVFFLGMASQLFVNVYINFILSTAITLVVIIMIYKLLLRPQRNNIVLLLLVGIVISTLASNFTNILQVFMNPEEFQSVKAITSVTISNIEVNLVWLTLPILIVLFYLIYRKHHTYDVMALGEEQAINLGVDYYQEQKFGLVYVAIAISIVTALVGPLAFLGLITANSAREITKTTSHKHLFITSSLLGAVLLILGQAIIEITGFLTTVTVLINFVGGVYMIYLIFKERVKN